MQVKYEQHGRTVHEEQSVFLPEIEGVEHSSFFDRH